MVSKEDLSLIDRFDTDGGLALSLCLDVSTADRREGALDRVRARLGVDLADTPPSDPAAALAEDLDMVDFYLSTTTARRLRYVAIFSCARQLFWRAFPLEELDTERIEVGPGFVTEPLRLMAMAYRHPAMAPQADLLLMD